MPLTGFSALFLEFCVDRTNTAQAGPRLPAREPCDIIRDKRRAFLNSAPVLLFLDVLLNPFSKIGVLHIVRNLCFQGLLAAFHAQQIIALPINDRFCCLFLTVQGIRHDHTAADVQFPQQLLHRRDLIALSLWSVSFCHPVTC